MSESKPPIVAIRYPVWSRYWQSVLPGILDFLTLREPWRLQTEDNSYGEMEAVRIDEKWKGDGAILFRATEAELKAFRKRGQAVVLTSTEGPDGGYPRVVPDNEAIGRMAAEHLMETGVQQVAFLGRGETLYAEEHFAPGFRVYPRERLKGFSRCLAEFGMEPTVCFLPGHELWKPTAWRGLRNDVKDFLKGLTLPCGLFVVDDALGAVVMKAADELGICIPQDLMLVSFGDDPLFCLSHVPALSSICYPGRQTGYLAAELIEKQLSGVDCRGVVRRVAVTEMVKRGSSDHLATSDEAVGRAVAWIRRHAPTDPLQVAELEAASGLSVSALTPRFRKVVGRSPKQEISRVRLDRLKQLLRTSEAPLAEISRVMKFSSPHELSRFFLNETGERPSGFRERLKQEWGAPKSQIVIFDLDGTLLDSEPLYCDAYRAAMKECGGSLSRDEYFARFAGTTNASIERELCGRLAGMDVAGFGRIWRKQFAQILERDGLALKPGVAEMLRDLRAGGLRLAVASSSDGNDVRACLTRAGLAEHFEVLACGDEVAAGKPAPDIFLLAASRMQVSPEDCLVIEDSNAGVAAAHRAGMRVVMIPDVATPEPSSLSVAEEVVSTMNESSCLNSLLKRDLSRQNRKG